LAGRRRVRLDLLWRDRQADRKPVRPLYAAAAKMEEPVHGGWGLSDRRGGDPSGV